MAGMQGTKFKKLPTGVNKPYAKSTGHEVQWVLRAKLKSPDLLESFKTTWATACEHTAREAGSVYYEAFFCEELQLLEVYEKYETSVAALEHVGKTFPIIAEAFFAAVDVETPLNICGSPDEAVLKALQGFNGVKFTRLADGVNK